MKTTYTATELAKKLNEMGYAYYGDKAKAWEGKGQSRIYFGKDYLTLIDGELTNRNLRKARALTIGDPALEAAIEAIEALDAEAAEAAAKAEAAAEVAEVETVEAAAEVAEVETVEAAAEVAEVETVEAAAEVAEVETRSIKTAKGNTIDITALGFHRFEVCHNGQRVGEFTYLAHSKCFVGHDCAGSIGLGTYAQSIVEAMDEAATEERMFADYAALTPAERAKRERAEYNQLQLQWMTAQDEGYPLEPRRQALEAHRARYAKWDARLA